ncbi:hypothetical protein M433DRAFT_527374 [Acidomyces richmondensis BFW]|nr:MAG: hypothetical protein FE78DRAFT_282029 [Acidomyces sp. 'richmondensis']KYG46977.1 hypothetical protein M433DRAFT_527374 [Acidomyces richmondensis BFW]
MPLRATTAAPGLMPNVGSRRPAPAKSSSSSSDDEDDDSSPDPPTQLPRPSSPTSSEFGASGNEHDTAPLDQMVKKLVRLALACELQRRPLRRVEVGEKVLGSAGARRWKEVLGRAQMQLRTVFGMELVELPGRERITVAQKRAAQKQSSQIHKPPASWILTSILPAPFKHPEILCPAAIPTSTEESTYIALYTLLISLIALSGGTLPDAKLNRYLRRLDLADRTPLSSASATEAMLRRMEREGYVTKVRESTGTGEEDIYWVVGPRGKVEVGEEGVRGLVKAVYGGEEVQELERRVERSLGAGMKEESDDDDDDDLNDE